MDSMQPKFQPLNDYILIRQEKAPETSKGGIHLPDVAKSNYDRGEIVAVAAGIDRSLLGKIGWFRGFSAHKVSAEEIGWPEGEYMAITLDDLIGVSE